MAWTNGNYSVFVAVYHADGSVTVEHGGIDLGHGINTKANKYLLSILCLKQVFQEEIKLIFIYEDDIILMRVELFSVFMHSKPTILCIRSGNELFTKDTVDVP